MLKEAASYESFMNLKGKPEAMFEFRMWLRIKDAAFRFWEKASPQSSNKYLVTMHQRGKMELYTENQQPLS